MNLKHCLVLTCVLLLGACNTFRSDAERPARLVSFDAEVQLRSVWRQHIGNGQGIKYHRLRPVIEDDMIYVAAYNGEVRALNRENGRTVWRQRTRYAITGGLRLVGDDLYFGTEDAHLVALDKRSGQLRWASRVPSEVLAVPAGNGSAVVVQTIDGRVSALNANTGEQLWIYEVNEPALTLRGTSSPIIAGDTVLAGFGNGMLLALNINNGALRWEERLALPTGRNELDRVIDIDGEMLVVGGNVFVPGYQGYLTMLDLNTGQIRWRMEESSTVAAAVGFGNVYVSTTRGHVRAYRQAQGELIWENDQLDLRRLSSPFSFGNYIAVADYRGYVHLMSQVDGRFVGRTRVDRSGVRTAVPGPGNMLYVYGNDGILSALRVQ